jgi:hypothetical protein
MHRRALPACSRFRRLEQLLDILLRADRCTRRLALRGQSRRSPVRSSTRLVLSTQATAVLSRRVRSARMPNRVGRPCKFATPSVLQSDRVPTSRSWLPNPWPSSPSRRCRRTEPRADNRTAGRCQRCRRSRTSNTEPKPRAASKGTNCQNSRRPRRSTAPQAEFSSGRTTFVPPLAQWRRGERNTCYVARKVGRDRVNLYSTATGCLELVHIRRVCPGIRKGMGWAAPDARGSFVPRGVHVLTAVA